ncbi:unnamed protein product [Paramecium sonneborni]|uniref:Transmembrane protein n=1 Tax=Paramecium sonneborni TaxID=65129 RepID=A0A8S1KA00_9CILI|nr:unnamed protein product [Paramecium sonneborni]
MITMGLLTTFIVRVLYCLIFRDYEQFYYKIGMLLFIVIQYAIVWLCPKFTRLAFLITNILLMGFSLEEEPSPILQNAKGANLMAINIMIILSGEFIDSVIQLFVITGLRITIIIVNNDNNYIILSSIIIVSISLLYYAYSFHKARRSQYLLGLVENGWDQMFFQLIREPYILLKFCKEKLNFSVFKHNRFPFNKLVDFNSYEEDSQERKILNFLSTSNVGKISLSQFIYENLKKFRADLSQIFNQKLRIRFQRQLFQIDMSIFQSKYTMVLLKIESSNTVNLKQLKKYKQRFNLYNNTIINLLGRIESEVINNVQIKVIKRKLVLIRLIEDLLEQKYQFNTVNIPYLFSQILEMYPDKRIIINDVNKVETVYTINNVILMSIILIFENSSNREAINCNIEKLRENQSIRMEFIGNFKQNLIRKTFKNTSFQVRLVIDNMFISQRRIQFEIYMEPFCSTSIDIFTYEYYDLFSDES